MVDYKRHTFLFSKLNLINNSKLRQWGIKSELSSIIFFSLCSFTVGYRPLTIFSMVLCFHPLCVISVFCCIWKFLILPLNLTPRIILSTNVDSLFTTLLLIAYVSRPSLIKPSLPTPAPVKHISLLITEG